jgi:hypothetical protein
MRRILSDERKDDSFTARLRLNEKKGKFNEEREEDSTRFKKKTVQGGRRLSENRGEY